MPPGSELLCPPRPAAHNPLHASPFVSFLSLFLLVIVSALSPFSLSLSAVLSPFLLVTVFALSPFCLLLVPLLVGHSVCSLFVLHSCWSLCPSCLSSVSFCFPSCLPSCWSLCPFLFSFLSFSLLVSLLVGLLVSLLDGHCVRLVSILCPFVSGLVPPFVVTVSVFMSRFGACTAGVPGHAAFQFICLQSDFFTFSPNSSQCLSRGSALLRDSVSDFRRACHPFPSCWSLCPPCLPSVSFCLPYHCVRLVSLLFAFVSLLVSFLVGHCVRRLVSGIVSLLVGHCVCLVSLFTKASEASWSYSCDSKVSFDRVQILTPDFSGPRPPYTPPPTPLPP